MPSARLGPTFHCAALAATASSSLSKMSLCANSRADAPARVAKLAEDLADEPPSAVESAFSRDPAAAAAALQTLRARDRLVAFVGKLIVSKGIDLLAAAWPLVLGASAARRGSSIVGFGAYRRGSSACSLRSRRRPRAARARAGGPGRGGRAERGPLRHLLAFLDGSVRRRVPPGRRPALGDRVVLTGRLEHAELRRPAGARGGSGGAEHLPEAFGMVAAEAAACGALPSAPITRGWPR